MRSAGANDFYVAVPFSLFKNTTDFRAKQIRFIENLKTKAKRENAAAFAGG
jgi:hypothetical protein